MTTEPDFLAAISQDRDDHDRRLVFADWLEERSHTARADFVRLDARLRSYDPEATSSDLRCWDDQFAALPDDWHGVFFPLVCVEPNFGPLQWHPERPGRWRRDRCRVGGLLVQVAIAPGPDHRLGDVFARAWTALGHVRRREFDYRRRMAWEVEHLCRGRDRPAPANVVMEILRLVAVWCEPDGHAVLQWEDFGGFLDREPILTSIDADGDVIGVGNSITG